MRSPRVGLPRVQEVRQKTWLARRVLSLGIVRWFLLRCKARLIMPVAKGIRAAEPESRIWKGVGNSLRRASGDECGDNAIGE
jgi:hypothetical protein